MKNTYKAAHDDAVITLMFDSLRKEPGQKFTTPIIAVWWIISMQELYKRQWKAAVYFKWEMIHLAHICYTFSLVKVTLETNYNYPYSLIFFFAEINSGRDTTVAERHTTGLGILRSWHWTAEGGGGPWFVKLVCIQDVTTKWRTISVTLRSLPLGSWLKVGKSLDGPRFVLN